MKEARECIRWLQVEFDQLIARHNHFKTSLLIMIADEELGRAQLAARGEGNIVLDRHPKKTESQGAVAEQHVNDE